MSVIDRNFSVWRMLSKRTDIATPRVLLMVVWSMLDSSMVTRDSISYAD